MKIIKMSELSEEEKNKIFEDVNNRINKNQQERQQVIQEEQQSANQAFNNNIQKMGEYNTQNHSTTYKNILNALDSKEQQKTFKKANNLTFAGYLKDSAQSIWNKILTGSQNKMANQRTVQSPQIIRGNTGEIDKQATEINMLKNQAKMAEDSRRISAGVERYNLLKEQREKEAKEKIAKIESKIKEASKNKALPTSDIVKLRKELEEANNSLKSINKDIISVADQTEVANATEITPLGLKAMQEAEQKNKNIEKGGVDAFNEYIESTGNAIPGGVKSVVAGLANDITTPTALILKGAEKAVGMTGNEKLQEKIQNAYEKVVDAGKDINESGNYHSLVNSQVKDDFTRKSADTVNTVSQVGTVAGISWLTGLPGPAIQGAYVGGSSAQEVLNENKDNVGRATITGLAKGVTSYFTEKMFDANILTKGGKRSSIQNLVDKKIEEKITSQFGKKIANKVAGIFGENVEEIVEDNVDNLIDKVVNNKDMPGFKEWLTNTSETIQATTISTIILDLLGLGGTNYEEIQKDEQAQKYIDKARQIIKENNMNVQYDQNELTNFLKEMKNNENQDNKLIDQEIKTAQNGLSQEQNINNNQSLKSNQYKKYNVKEIPEKNGTAFQVDSDIMDVVGHIPNNGDMPFIDQIFYNSKVSEDSYNEQSIPKEYLRKGNATNHVLSALEYFKRKGINEFQVKTMNENSNALMESLVRKGYVEQLSDYKYLGDDVTYKINNQNNTETNVTKRLMKNGNFSEQIDKYTSNKLPSNELFYLGNTPKVMQDLGIKNNPITMTQKALNHVIAEGESDSHNHSIPIETVKKIPEALNKPLNILKSSSRENSIVVITDLADISQRPIVASIEIDSNGQIGEIEFLSNKLTSAYGKNNYDEFMQREIAKGNLLYDIDEGIIKESALAGVQSPESPDSFVDTVDSVSTTNNIISQNSQNMQEKSENEINPYRNTAKANKLIKEKNEKIRQLNSNLKQVTSEEARKSIQNEINNLEKDYNDRIQKLYDEVNNTTQNSTSQNDSDSKNPTRHEVMEKNRELARENIKNIANWKDKKNGLSYQLETMERNMYDIIQDKEEAKKINDTYFEPIHKAEAEKQKFINKYNAQIKELDLNKYESEAVQFLGEKKYNPSFSQGDSESIAKRNEVQARIDKNIENGKIDKNKVNNAIETFRNIYDELFDAENNALRENGYKEKPYRKGYFPHFIDYVPETKTEKVLNALGFKIDKRPLPTDIAGITEQFVPGKTWNRSALERKSNKTDYNALKGFDTYISQAADNIFHTDNIQKLRGLENEIRYQYSDKGIQNRIDEILNNDVLYEDEKQDLINQIFDQVDNPMSNLVTELRRYTNALANKKSEADRSAENKYGRAIYNTVNAIENRFGANAVGLNIGSAVTNFIPITQAYSQVSTKNMTRATIDTIKSYLNDDGFAEKSAFLTSRLNQSEKLYKTTLEKISDKTSFLFNAIDDVTSNIVVRGKYLENIQSGMSESEAIKNADQFARNVIADRSKGALPTKFEEKNPITKMLSQFQLEVNNQYRYMFKDIPRDLADKGLGSIAMAFFKMFVAAWLYNKASEKITGRKPAFSPIDLAVSTYNTFTNDNLKTYDKIAKTAKEMGEQLPFVGGLIGGGRVPVNGALPNISNLTKARVGLATGEMDSKKAANTIGKELSKPLYYLLPPFGGAQIKKSVEGIKTVKDGGSYGVDNKGEETLQFPVENATAKDYIKAGVFGKYALPLAKDYTDSGYKSLNAKQTKIYKESNLPYKELLQYIDQGLKKNEDKIDYISSQKMNEQQKWGIYKYDIFSSTEREDGGSQLKDAEYITSHGVSKNEYIKLYNKAQKNNIDMPTADEYKEMKSKNISLNTYINYKTSIKEQLNAKKKSGELDEKGQLKDKDKIDVLLKENYTNAEKKSLYENYIGTEDDLYSKALSKNNIDITSYLKYKIDTSNISADKDEDGKSISGSSKKKYYDYVNKNITGYANRLLILGSKYKLSDTERKALADYVNKNYSKKDLIGVYEQLDKNFTIKNGKVYYK